MAKPAPAPVAPIIAPTPTGVRNALIIRAMVAFGASVGRAWAKAERANAALAKARAKAEAEGKPAPLPATVARDERDRMALAKAFVAFGIAVQRADHARYLASLPVWAFGPGRVTGNGIASPHRARGAACRRIGGGSDFGSRCHQTRVYFARA